MLPRSATFQFATIRCLEIYWLQTKVSTFQFPTIRCLEIYWLQTKVSYLLELFSLSADGTTSTADGASRPAVVPSADNFPRCKQTRSQ